MLTPYLPYPPSSGGQVRSYNLIKNLAKDHKITLFSLIKNESEKEYVKELEKYCQKVTPRIAYRGYGICTFPALKTPERSKSTNVAMLSIGRANAQKTPTKDCLYIAKKSLRNNWYVNHLFQRSSSMISRKRLRYPFLSELSGS